jgi:hypothetical protein
MNPGPIGDRMEVDRVEKIAQAVLYEGYMLYPYRASAVKNQQRWNFGVLCPRSYSEQNNGSEAWMMQTECLLEGGPSTCLTVKVRFLHIVDRSIGRLAHALDERPSGREPEFEIVDRLNVGGQTYVHGQEAAEREVNIPSLHPCSPSFHRSSMFEFPSGREFEPLRDENGLISGVVIRQWETLYGSVEIDSIPCQEALIEKDSVGEGPVKVTVRVRNLMPGASSKIFARADALRVSLISTHTIVALENAQFVSLLDPPERLRGLAGECRNIGTWPVLVGEGGERNMMLSSPIILYDYPQIAPESPGSLFDGTEIDEILSLRILTMTDDEKDEMRQSDRRAREILERTENMPPEQFMKLHGALRGLQPMNKGTR